MANQIDLEIAKLDIEFILLNFNIKTKKLKTYL